MVDLNHNGTTAVVLTVVRGGNGLECNTARWSNVSAEILNMQGVVSFEKMASIDIHPVCNVCAQNKA